MKKARPCRYCASGHAPNASGEHWIVKSIVPARIDIRRCTAAAADRVRA
jgi:hypothetical protein